MNWVEMLETNAGIGGSEPPGDCTTLPVPAGFSGGRLPRQGPLVWNTAGRTLTPQDAELDLRHIEPTPVKCFMSSSTRVLHRRYIISCVSEY